MSCNNKVNYQLQLEKITKEIDIENKPSLLIHSCCAPCSSYCLVYLRKWFDITCLYYNPNITLREEYDKRVAEMFHLKEALSNDPIYIDRDEHGNSVIVKGDDTILDELGTIEVICGEYNSDYFLELVKANDLANEPEGGRRCEMCFDLRLNKTYEIANRVGAQYFSTTLTISPLKNEQLLNDIGYRIAAAKNDVMWLPSDFKKKNGYKLSTELCKRYNLYRQNYCGCVYSKI